MILVREDDGNNGKAWGNGEYHHSTFLKATLTVVGKTQNLTETLDVRGLPIDFHCFFD